MARPKTARPEHNYLRKLRYLMAVGALPRDVGVHDIVVYHDTWCGIYQEKRCHCDPDIRLNLSQPDVSKN